MPPNLHNTGKPFRGHQGFSLVELLVVIAIIGVLLSILIVALSKARESARAVVCLSNLKQMQTGWLMFINQGDGKIPDTFGNPTGFTWWDAMDTVYDQAPDIYHNNGKFSFGVCPSIQTKYQNISYPGGLWGYAINSWWDSSLPDPHNNQQQWVAIVHPATYPWFVDTEIYTISGRPFATVRVPYSTAGAPDWGIGANHGDGTVANISFADGGARPIPIQEIRSNLASPNYAWLENR